MSDYGKIQWEVDSKYVVRESHEDLNTYEFFLKYCKDKFPHQNIVKSCNTFLTQKQQLQKQLKSSIELIAEQPLLTAFLVWVEESCVQSYFNLGHAKMLLEKGFIGISDQEGKVWTIAKARDFDQQNVINAIRCHYEWSTDLRESLVAVYSSFILWLSNITFGYIQKIEDPDLLLSNARAFPYALFLKFICQLKEKDRLVAKLLYFGGSRTLEEILDLKIEEIDFEKRIVHFGSKSISYPLHVFADFQSIIKDRKKGRVFLGRQNAPLNSATIFRNFKEAAIAIGIDQNLTPKMLVINK